MVKKEVIQHQRVMKTNISDLPVRRATFVKRGVAYANLGGSFSCINLKQIQVCFYFPPELINDNGQVSSDNSCSTVCKGAAFFTVSTPEQHGSIELPAMLWKVNLDGSEGSSLMRRINKSRLRSSLSVCVSISLSLLSPSFYFFPL